MAFVGSIILACQQLNWQGYIFIYLYQNIFGGLDNIFQVLSHGIIIFTNKYKREMHTLQFFLVELQYYCIML